MSAVPKQSAGGFTFRTDEQLDLFRHIREEKTSPNGVVVTFAAAERQFPPHLAPDEVLAAEAWEAKTPRLEEDAAVPFTPTRSSPAACC